MTDFINEFERMYHKLKQHKMELPDGVLAYRLLKSAHLSERHEQLARVTLTELTYDNMKGQLKIFGDSASLKNVSHMPSVKVELVLQVNGKEEEQIILNCNFLKSFVTPYTENTKPLMCTNFSCQYHCVFIVQSHSSLVHKMTQWYTSKHSWIHESCVPTISILNLNIGFKNK